MPYGTWLNTNRKIDTSSPLLSGIMTGITSETLDKNISWAGQQSSQPIYRDVYTIFWNDNNSQHKTIFVGTDLSISADGVASGVIEEVKDMILIDGFYGPDFLQIGRMSVDFQILRSVLSSTTFSDDIELFRTIFSNGNGISGSRYDDNLTSYDGNDILTPQEGNDFLDGGQGIDRVTFNDQFAMSKIFADFSGETVVLTPQDGIDTLRNIERLIFVDKIIALDIEGNAGQAYRIYQAAFDRKPDPTGLGFWIANLDLGKTLSTIADEFLNSPEFNALYGSSTPNASFVDSLYQNVLHRAGETEGVEYWNGLLNNGISRADVLVAFSESAENKAAVLGSIQNGIEYKEFLG